MNEIEDLKARIRAIEDRNKRVEADKAWEISWIRRLSIAFLTYVVIMIYLLVINNDRPFINAAVPAVGFFLSTLVLRQIRSLLQKHRVENI